MTTMKALPKGYRTLTPEEGDALVCGEKVCIFDRERPDGIVYAGTIESHGSEHINVSVHDRRCAEHRISFDRDDPDYWADGRTEPRRPPQSDGARYVLVCADLESPRRRLREASSDTYGSLP